MKTVKAYHPLIMAVHKFILIQVFVLVITGLPFFFKSFDFLPLIIGTPLSVVLNDGTTPLAAGMMIFRTIHWISGFLLTAGAIVFVLGILKDLKELSIWPNEWGVEAIKDGIEQMKLHYIDKKPAKFGKFNTGQKAAAWAIYFFVTVLIVTGFVLIYANAYVGEVEKSTMACMRDLHDISFVFLSLILIVHIIFALMPSNLPSLKAMFQTGEMDVDYIKEHHIYWYEDLKKKKIIEDRVEDKDE